MRLNVSAWAIRTPLPSIVFFTVVMLLGIFSFQSLPITRFPNIDVPLVAVTVTQRGASPSELEAQVAKRIEGAVANLTGPVLAADVADALADLRTALED